MLRFYGFGGTLVKRYFFARRMTTILPSMAASHSDSSPWSYTPHRLLAAAAAAIEYGECPAAPTDKSLIDAKGTELVRDNAKIARALRLAEKQRKSNVFPEPRKPKKSGPRSQAKSGF